MLRIVLILFGIAAAAVGALGLRGQLSSNRPWHVFLDMKYQPRYSAQGQSTYFADGRASRVPVAGTRPYDGAATRNDAGDHGDANPDFLPEADPIFFLGRLKPDEKRMVKVKVQKQRPKKDMDGKEYIKERVDLAKTKTNFWTDYKFGNPVTKKIEPKSAYCERLDDTVVCGGIYKK